MQPICRLNDSFNKFALAVRQLIDGMTGSDGIIGIFNKRREILCVASSKPEKVAGRIAAHALHHAFKLPHLLSHGTQGITHLCILLRVKDSPAIFHYALQLCSLRSEHLHTKTDELFGSLACGLGSFLLRLIVRVQPRIRSFLCSCLFFKSVVQLGKLLLMPLCGCRSLAVSIRFTLHGFPCSIADTTAVQRVAGRDVYVTHKTTVSATQNTVKNTSLAEERTL